MLWVKYDEKLNKHLQKFQFLHSRFVLILIYSLVVWYTQYIAHSLLLQRYLWQQRSHFVAILQSLWQKLRMNKIHAFAEWPSDGIQCFSLSPCWVLDLENLNLWLIGDLLELSITTLVYKDLLKPNSGQLMIKSVCVKLRLDKTLVDGTAPTANCYQGISDSISCA